MEERKKSHDWVWYQLVIFFSLETSRKPKIGALPFPSEFCVVGGFFPCKFFNTSSLNCGLHVQLILFCDTLESPRFVDTCMVLAIMLASLEDMKEKMETPSRRPKKKKKN
jgi:hypothetical protein